MSKFPPWFPTYNEIDAFLASKMEHDRRHQRITWVSYQALTWAKMHTVTDKTAILCEIYELLHPINYEALMRSHCATRSQAKPQFTTTNQGAGKLV